MICTYAVCTSRPGEEDQEEEEGEGEDVASLVTDRMIAEAETTGVT